MTVKACLMDDYTYAHGLANIIKIGTYSSLSNLFRLQMLIAVCRTSIPKLRLLTTIPSTRGIAMVVLKHYDMHLKSIQENKSI